MFEAKAGEVTSSTRIRRPVPVTDYLRIQTRYAHLFKPRNQHRGNQPHPGGRQPTATSHKYRLASPGPERAEDCARPGKE